LTSVGGGISLIWRRRRMAKFLGIASYTPEGVQGLLKDGGSKRRDVIAKAVEALGGTLEAYYFAFGDADAYVTVDVPDNVSAAAVSLAVNATGAASAKMVGYCWRIQNAALFRVFGCRLNRESGRFRLRSFIKVNSPTVSGRFDDTRRNRCRC